ncbi:MAG: TRAP transporter permease [Alphaproteobacteria bacterium]
MSEGLRANRQLSESELDELVAATDTGGRQPGRHVARLIACIALAWSLFQLWVASPLPFIVGNILPVLNGDEVKSIHLAFAIFLAYLVYPAYRRAPRDRVPLYDWVLAAVAAFCAAYLYLFFDALGRRQGLPTDLDLWVAGIGIVLLLEATRRALGPPLMIVALVFLAYVFFGSSEWVPGVIQWKGASFARAMTHMWLTTEGIYGVALDVSASFVFLFVLFGALLDKAGAGSYFIKVAFSLLGHLRGGPAKAAVLSSGLTGLISGSSIANVVTTGTFTIPLMRRVGYSGEKAGSVEVAASVNGQIMPPVMGAAAFLMTEFVGISYSEVIQHAILPAVTAYISLLYIVHLEALKLGLKTLPRSGPVRALRDRLIGFLTGFLIVAVMAAVVYYGLGWMPGVFGDASGWIVAVLVLAAHVGLVAWTARHPDLAPDDPRAPVLQLPEFAPTAVTGVHYLLPIVVLVWNLMVEHLSPGLSAFWATLLLLVILVTQRPLKALFRGEGALATALWRGIDEMGAGLISGARNMVAIALATATAGIIVGTVSLTGVGIVMAEFVEYLSGGNLMLVLIFTAVISLILGMGLPTTANYIVVSSLMALVIVELGAQNGLVVPLIAAHLFVFYFGIMADVTPPVGLAAFAASAISGADPIKTGFQAFFYEIRTALLPFLFIFNTDLLLINVGWLDGTATFIVSVGAMLIFAAATQGWFVTRSRLWESAVLLVVALSLFRPGFWLDLVDPPYDEVPPATIVAYAGAQPADAVMRVTVRGETLDGKTIEKTVRLPLGATGPGEKRLAEAAGIAVAVEGERTIVDDVSFGGPAEKAKIDLDWEIVKLEHPRDRPPKQLFYIPALLLLGLVVLVQRRRAGADGRRAAATA